MRNIPISKFKAHALGLVKAIAETGEGIIVTKRGKPLVRVEPYAPGLATPEPGRLAGTVTFAEDLIQPAAAIPRAPESPEAPAAPAGDRA